MGGYSPQVLASHWHATGDATGGRTARQAGRDRDPQGRESISAQAEKLTMNRRVTLATAVGSLALCTLLEIAPANAADEGAEQDHLLIFELGASGEREISEHTSHIGPAVGLEIEPIERRATPSARSNRFRR